MARNHRPTSPPPHRSPQAVGEVNPKDGTREGFFEFNGMPRSVTVPDRSAKSSKVVRPKATDAPGSVGAPMPGVVLSASVKTGQTVNKGCPMVILSAMKMETVVAAPIGGKVSEVAVAAGDDVQAQDLLVSIVPLDSRHPGKDGAAPAA